jgi:hypothetical protein
MSKVEKYISPLTTIHENDEKIYKDPSKREGSLIKLYNAKSFWENPNKSDKT